LELAPVMIVRRKAFPNASASGLSVLEYGDLKAREEFGQLTQLLSSIRTDSGAISYAHR